MQARLLIAIGLVAAWSIAPPYLFELDVADDVEFVDHAVPGLLAVGAALYAIGSGSAAAVGICALAGTWETLTHLTLLLDAGDPGKPVGTVLMHFIPGPALAGLSLWALLR